MSEPPEFPYKGLNAFDDSELDALLFFGRERETEVVVANLIASRLTVLYGPSGVGKSSLLKAAVARRLRELPEAPLVVLFSRWGGDPAAALARAVGGDGASAVDALERAQSECDVYVVLDQMEEYFLYHADDSGPGSLAEALPALLAAPLRVNVLISLREDSLAKLDRFRGRIPGLFANTLRLDLLDREAARAAITRPVERFDELTGAEIVVEPALVERVLDDVAAGRIDPGLGGSGAVAGENGPVRIEAPYLQLVMQRVWEEERAAGSSVLRVETLERLGGAPHVVEEHLEGALAELSPGQRDVAARLFDHLVTPSGTKIAHETSDLADFGHVTVDEVEPVLAALAERRILRSLDEGGRVRHEIFHDVLAEPVLAWRARHRAERELERRLEEAHQRRRRLQVLIGLALLALAVMVAVTAFALDQRAEARQQADRAQARELEALSAWALPVDPELGLMLALESAQRSPTESTEDTLRRALLASRLVATFDVGEPVLDATVLARDVLAVTESGAVMAANLETHRSRTVAETGVDATSASFSQDGTAFVVGDDGGVRVVRPDGDSYEIAGVSGARGAEPSVDGRRVLLIVEGGARLVDAETGRGIRSFRHPGATSGAISVAEAYAVTGAGNASVRLWRVDRGGVWRRLVGVGEAGSGRIVALAFSPRGTHVAGGAMDGSTRLWRVTQRTPVSILTGHRGAVTALDFSDDGVQLVTAGKDRTARVWRVDSGDSPLEPFTGHTGPVASASFLGDVGSPIITAGADGTVRLWDTTVQPQLDVLARLGERVRDVEYGRGGLELRATARRRVHVLDPRTGEELRAEQAPPPSRTVAGPDGATATIDGEVVVVRSGAETVLLEGHDARVTSVAFSADGERVVTGSEDREARIWDSASGETVWTLTGHRKPVRDAAFSPNGRWVVTAGHGTAGLWDARTGALAFFLRGHAGPLTAATFDPTGSVIVTGGVDRTVRIFECQICGDVDALVELATQRLRASGRELTPAEREQYLRE